MFDCVTISGQLETREIPRPSLPSTVPDSLENREQFSRNAVPRLNFRRQLDIYLDALFQCPDIQKFRSVRSPPAPWLVRGGVPRLCSAWKFINVVWLEGEGFFRESAGRKSIELSRVRSEARRKGGQGNCSGAGIAKNSLFTRQLLDERFAVVNRYHSYRSPGLYDKQRDRRFSRSSPSSLPLYVSDIFFYDSCSRTRLSIFRSINEPSGNLLPKVGYLERPLRVFRKYRKCKFRSSLIEFYYSL